MDEKKIRLFDLESKIARFAICFQPCLLDPRSFHFSRLYKKKILLPSIVSWCKGSLESRLQSRPWSIAEFDRISFAGIRMRSIGRAVRGILFTFGTSISSIATTNDRGRTDGRVSTLSLKILAYPRAISSLVSLPRKYTRHMPTRRVSLRIVFPRKLFFFNLYPPHSSARYSRA